MRCGRLRSSLRRRLTKSSHSLPSRAKPSYILPFHLAAPASAGPHSSKPRVGARTALPFAFALSAIAVLQILAWIIGGGRSSARDACNPPDEHVGRSAKGCLDVHQSANAVSKQ